jgi:hypothetical protein
MRPVLGFLALLLAAYGISSLVFVLSFLTSHWIGKAVVLSLAFYALVTLLLLPRRHELQARGIPRGSVFVLSLLRAGLTRGRAAFLAWALGLAALGMLMPSVMGYLQPYAGTASNSWLFAELDAWQETTWAFGAAAAFWLLHEIAYATDVLEGVIPDPLGDERTMPPPRRRRRTA